MSESALLLSPEKRAATATASRAASGWPDCSNACAAHHVANPEFLVQRDSLAGVVERRLIIARLKRHLRRERVGHDILRIELARATHGRQCLAVPARLREQVPERHVCKRIPWIEIDRPPECRLCCRPVPLEYPVQVSDRVLCLREIGVGTDGPLQQSLAREVSPRAARRRY